MRATEDVERIVVVEPLEGVWRVRAAHMEPLQFRSHSEAERAGGRVAKTLAGLGFKARVDVYDEAGAVAAAIPYAPQPDARPSPRRRLDS